MGHQMRTGLSAQGMYSLIHEKSLQIPDNRQHRPQTIPLPDAVMSALAMFAFKNPSMLQFCGHAEEPGVKSNLKRLFQIGRIPSDTTMREILDPIPTSEFQKVFKSLFTLAQRGKALEKYPYLGGKYLLSIDGTGCFSSPTIHCDNCCEKNVNRLYSPHF